MFARMEIRWLRGTTMKSWPMSCTSVVARLIPCGIHMSLAAYRTDESAFVYLKASVLSFIGYARFLAYVDLLGTRYQSSSIATGFGAYLAQPLLRKAVEGNEDTMTFEEAKALLESCMRVMYYRDARAINKVNHVVKYHMLLFNYLVGHHRSCLPISRTQVPKLARPTCWKQTGVSPMTSEATIRSKRRLLCMNKFPGLDFDRVID